MVHHLPDHGVFPVAIQQCEDRALVADPQQRPGHGPDGDDWQHAHELDTLVDRWVLYGFGLIDTRIRKLPE